MTGADVLGEEAAPSLREGPSPDEQPADDPKRITSPSAAANQAALRLTARRLPHASKSPESVRELISAVAALCERQTRRGGVAGFWQHCADCDPSGTPCPAYGALW